MRMQEELLTSEGVFNSNLLQLTRLVIDFFCHQSACVQESVHDRASAQSTRRFAAAAGAHTRGQRARDCQRTRIRSPRATGDYPGTTEATQFLVFASKVHASLGAYSCG
jgi:hypothetical protein